MFEPRGQLVGIGILLVLLLGAQLGTTIYFIDRERSYHTEQFTEQTRHRLQTAVDRVDKDLDKLSNISELLARLVTTDDLSQHERELRAAIRHQRGLLSATLWDTEGEQRAFVLSESISNTSRKTHVDLLERTHQRLIERETRIAMAGPSTDSSDRHLRAFVQSAGGEDSPFTHVGVVIDVQTALSQLSSLATRSETDIIVYDPEGYVESASTLAIPSTWQTSPDDVPDFYAQMSESRSGSERFSPEVAAQLGLPEHERVVHFMSFESSDGIRWSIGMITSLLPLRTEQSGVIWRAGLVSAAFGLLLFGLGGLLMFSIRRRSELEERLERKQLISELDAKADAILDAIPVGVVVVDEAGYIRDINKEMTAWLGADSLDERLIVRQLLDFSRDGEAEIQPTDLKAIVESTLQLVEFQTENSKIELDLELPDALPEVAANPDELRQVLINLLLNALDACDGRGTISLEARLVNETPLEGSKAVDITVEDTGHGIEAENVHKIFDPFYTTKKRGKGTDGTGARDRRSYRTGPRGTYRRLQYPRRVDSIRDPLAHPFGAPARCDGDVARRGTRHRPSPSRIVNV